MTAPKPSSTPQPEPTPGAGSRPDPTGHPQSPLGDARASKLEFSPIKIAAGAVAAAAAAAIGSTLGVAGTIVGAAVASVVSASASAVLSHSLERGKNAALKALPLPAYGYSARRTDDTWGMADVQDAQTAIRPVAVKATRAGAATEADAETDGTEAEIDGAETDGAAAGSQSGAEPKTETDTPAKPTTLSRWTRRPGWKPVAVVTALSFVVGTGTVTSIELARGRSFPGVDGGVLSNDGGSGQEQHPSPMTPGGGSGHQGGGSTVPPTPTTTPSGPATPSSSPSTPAPTTPTPDSSETPSLAPSTNPSSTPTAPPSSTPLAPTGSGASSTPGQATSPAPVQPSGTTSS